MGMLVSVCGRARLETFMSSGHNPGHTKSINRKRVDGSIINVECPLSIVDYNKYMGGVDRGDQYNVPVKSRKSYKYIFWFLFEVCVLNSFIIILHVIFLYHPIYHLDYRYL